MDERYYDEFDNMFYNPDDDDARPGDNLNWKKIQRGFKRVEDKTDEDYDTLNDRLNNAVTELENTITDNVELLNHNKASIIVSSISGAVAFFTDGANDAPVKLLVVDIKPVQSGSGDPAPDNVRPILGWTQANITRAKDDINEQFNVVYPIIFPTEAGTVYGGILDVTNGVLTVEWQRRDFLATEYWAWNSSIKGFYKSTTVFNKNVDCYCNILPTDTITGARLKMGTNGFTFYDLDTLGITDAELWKTFLTEHEVYAVGKLLDPITYQLTPTEVRTLLGENKISADTGAIVNLEYRADTKLYLDNLTEPDADMIADANITSGSYFMVNNSLYIATAAIAAGETIVPGTNCTLTNLAAALNALNA